MTNEVTETAGTDVALTDEQLALMAGDKNAPAFGQQDLQTPILSIVQSGSAYMKRGEPEYIDGVREGDFIDNLTLVPRPEVRLVVCYVERTYTEWQPNRGPLVKMWGNDATGYEAATGPEWGVRKTAEGNDIVLSLTYYCLLLTDDKGGYLPVQINLSSTQFKRARRLNTLMQTFMLKGPEGPFIAPYYARIYNAKAVRESNEQGDWMSWHFEPGKMTLIAPGGAALYKQAQALHDSVKKGEMKPTTNAAAAQQATTDRQHAPQGHPLGEDELPF